MGAVRFYWPHRQPITTQLGGFDVASQRARLKQLDKTLRSGTASTPVEDPAISFARQWVVDHGVDASLFDLWRADRMIETDLRTYMVLRGACYETWLEFGVHVPVWFDRLHCDRIVELSAAEVPPCDCNPPCGPICELDTEWIDYNNNAVRRGYPMIVSLSDVAGFPERPCMRPRPGSR